ncbi:MAG: glycosyltransferase family 4 protein [Chloroflexi bacterium]|nr:glycosyltransferase family 4 protein [Chloroflexota bacterium]
MTDAARRLAFVTPRYGPEILGGAESLIRNTAERLAQRGHHVEVFSTHVTNLVTWEDAGGARTEHIHHVLTHRYPVHWVNHDRYDALHGLLLGHNTLTPDEQMDWLAAGPHSAPLYETLRRRKEDFDLFICAPYPFPLVHYAAASIIERCAIWPCLHDESYTRLIPTRLLLRDAFCVFFNTRAERALAESALHIQHPRTCVVGSGVEDIPGNPQRFRDAFNIHEPFLLYAGRLEEGKNVHLLLDLFEQYKSMTNNDLKLVLMGDGPCHRPSPHIIHLGFQQEQMKRDGMAAALALCQPSTNESLSFVILESWLAGVPVLVHSACPVTREHVVLSGGGLHFNGIDMFRAVIDTLIENPSLRRNMGQHGRQYVRTNYGWEATLTRFENALEEWLQ